MNRMIFAAAGLLALTGCEEPAAETEAPAETLDSYEASGTEPFWSVKIADSKMIHDSPEEWLKFTVPVMRSQRTDTGWEIKGFDSEHNINMTIELGKECSDGMSDRVYADTVKVAVGGSGFNNGCGGAFEGDEAP